MRQGSNKGGFFKAMRLPIVLLSLFALTFSFAFNTGTSMSKYVINREQTLTLTSGYWVRSVAISGTAQLGQTLASTLEPLGATVTYQWESSNTANGTFTPITGATSANYTMIDADLGRFIRLSVVGSGVYSGTASSNVLGNVTTPLTSVTITGTAVVGNTLSMSTLLPAGATATYRWQRADDSGGTYADIALATSSSYTLTSADLGKFIRLAANGTGNYTGTVTSNEIGKVTTPLTSVTITGTAVVGNTLSMSTLLPAGATATYRWQRADVSGGTYADIALATSSSYTLTSADLGKFIRLAADGTGNYTSTVISGVFGPVTSPQFGFTVSATNGTKNGSTLTASKSPVEATVNYLWELLLKNGNWATIGTGPNFNTYTIANQNWQYIRVTMTGTGAYAGKVYIMLIYPNFVIVAPAPGSTLAAGMNTLLVAEAALDQATDPFVELTTVTAIIDNPTIEAAAEPSSEPLIQSPVEPLASINFPLDTEISLFTVPPHDSVSEFTAEPIVISMPETTVVPTLEPTAEPDDETNVVPTETNEPTPEPTAMVTVEPIVVPVLIPNPTVTSQPISLTITASSASKTYDGRPLTIAAYDVDLSKLQVGHSLTVMTEGSITRIGTAANKVFSYTITDTDGNDVHEQYAITLVDGELSISVNPVKINIIPVSAVKVYDGTPLSDNGYTLWLENESMTADYKPEKNEYELETGDILKALVSGSVTDIGTAQNTVTSFWVTSRSGEDVTNCYTFVRRFDIGTLEIIAPLSTPTTELMTEPTQDPLSATILPETPELTTAPTPTFPTEPTFAQTLEPTTAPTPASTLEPMLAPTPEPTTAPTPASTLEPTLAPTPETTTAPTPAPTLEPTLAPTPEPTTAPTPASTLEPTLALTPEPTTVSTPTPTLEPTLIPMPELSISPIPLSTPELFAEQTIQPSSVPITVLEPI